MSRDCIEEKRHTDLLIRKSEAELLYTALDGVPASKSVTDGDIASQSEIFRLEDLVCRRVVQNSFSVNTGLVRECAVTAVDGQCSVILGQV